MVAASDIGMVIAGGESAAGSGQTDLGGGTVGGSDTGGFPASAASGSSAVPPTPGSTSLQLPAPSTGATPLVLGNNAGRLGTGQLASAHRPGGIAGWWFLFLGLAAVVGAVLFPRVPGLLSTATASTCANERTTRRL